MVDENTSPWDDDLAGKEAGQAEPVTHESLAGFVAESQADAQAAADRLAKASAKAEDDAAKAGAKALKAAQEAEERNAALIQAAKDGATHPAAVEAWTQELAGKAEDTESFLASLQAADPNAVQTGGQVRGALREAGPGVFGGPNDVIEDIEP